MKKLLFFIVAVTALGAAVYWWVGSESNTVPEKKYVTVPVEHGSLRAEITCTGTLSPRVEVLVGSQVSGTIKELYADFESKVKKGQLIALIDPDKFRAKAEQARADLSAARAGLAKSEVTLSDEMRDLRRKEGLIEKESVSRSEYDTAKTEADAAEAQVVVDRAKVAQMEAKLKEAELELKYTRITAPVDGVVVARNMDVGQTVTASFQTPVLFKIAEDLTRMQVNTNVDEADIGRVRVGQEAVFTVPAFPDTLFNASVSQIRNEPRIEQNVVTYNVVLHVNNDKLELRPGMTANVQILISEVERAKIVPEQAFRFTPKSAAMSQGKAELPRPKLGYRRVWKQVAANNLVPVTVKVGISGTQGVQVFSDDLKSGDSVVVEAVAKKKSSQKRGFRLRF